jgi:hypothetical protein
MIYHFLRLEEKDGIVKMWDCKEFKCQRGRVLNKSVYLEYYLGASEGAEPGGEGLEGGRH